MDHGIARNEAVSARAFPPLDTDPYAAPDSADLTPAQRAARQVLALARRRLPWRARLGGEAAPADAVARLLWLHRHAVAAESGGQRGRANFWWSQVQEQWRRLPPGHPVWEELAQPTADGAALADAPAGARARLARELLLDTHLAFVNGLSGDDPRSLPPRACWHLQRARDFVADAALGPEAAEDLEMQPYLQRIGAHVERREWDQAIAAAEELAGFRPQAAASGDLLAFRRRQAAEACRAEENWEAARTHAEWLTRHLPDHAPYERLLSWVLYEGTLGYRRQRSWDAAERFAIALARMFPDRLDYGELAEGVARGRLDDLVRSKAWAEALALSRRLAVANRDRPADLERYAEVHLRAAADIDSQGLSLEKEEAARRDAGQIEGHITELEAFLREVPECAPAYDALGLLYQRQAVCLANGERPSQALLAVGRSLAYRPEGEEARDAEAQIGRLLKDLQKQVRELEGKYRSLQGGMAYQVRGKMAPYEEEARAGTGPRDDFRRSKEPEQIRAAKARARARWFWLRVGLPRPVDDREWDRRARSFDEATDRLMAAKPQTGTDLLERWAEIVAAMPRQHLEDVDPLDLLRFFSRKDEAEAAAEADPPPPEPAPEEGPPGPEQALPRLDTEGRHVPCLTAAVPARPAEGEDVPFEFWLFSGRDAAAKVVAAAALLVVGVAGVLAVADLRARRVRDAAYAQLTRAARELDVGLARDAAARFEAVAPLAREDARLAQVWVLEDELPDWGSLRRRNEAYARLVAAAQAEDAAAAAQAAEDFLAAPTGKAGDLRREQVKQLLDRAREVPRRRARDAAYDELADAAQKQDDAAAIRAADRFLAGTPTDEEADRSKQVWGLRAEALEAPARRKRDAAYARLLADFAARPVKDVEAARHAQEFLDAQSAKAPERRAEQVETLRQYAAETPRRRLRDAAYTRLLADLRADPIKDVDAVEAAKAFLDAPPDKEEEPRTEAVRKLLAFAGETPKRRLRDAAYESLRKAAARQDEKGVEAAAKAFVDAEGQEDDPRQAQVTSVRGEAREWPNRRRRDTAYGKLQAARRKDDAVAVLRAAEEYLEAPPVAGEDPRTPQVLARYGETFADWLLRQHGTLNDKARARVNKYRSLVLNSKKDAQP